MSRFPSAGDALVCVPAMVVNPNTAVVIIQDADILPKMDLAHPTDEMVESRVNELQAMKWPDIPAVLYKMFMTKPALGLRVRLELQNRRRLHLQAIRKKELRKQKAIEAARQRVVVAEEEVMEPLGALEPDAVAAAGGPEDLDLAAELLTESEASDCDETVLGASMECDEWQFLFPTAKPKKRVSSGSTSSTRTSASSSAASSSM